MEQECIHTYMVGLLFKKVLEQLDGEMKLF